LEYSCLLFILTKTAYQRHSGLDPESLQDSKAVLKPREILKRVQDDVKKGHIIKTPSYTYILSNKKQGTLYIGVTSDLIKRIYEHKQKAVKGFSNTYNLDKLVYYEVHDTIELAIAREKQLKNWHRQWKINLIEENNPDWNDLYEFILQ
jgi:putative endonuclease